MKKLNQELKNKEYHRLYLLHGEETYLRKQYKERLVKALLGDGSSMNYHYYQGKNVSIRELIDHAETLPFFSERRVIVIEESVLFEKDRETQDVSLLTEYLKDIPATTVIVFVEGKTDKRLTLYKTIKKYGSIAEFETPKEGELYQWVAGMVKKEGMEILPDAVRHLFIRAGVDMNQIKSEVDKLLSYCYGKKQITVEDVDKICVKQLQNNIFEMIDAIALKQQKKALDIYYDMLAAKEPPIKILILIGRQFNLLLQVKELSKKGYGKEEISSRLGLHPFVAQKCRQQAENFKVSQLKSAVEECVQADEDIKTGKMTELLALELFIVKHSHSDKRK